MPASRRASTLRPLHGFTRQTPVEFGPWYRAYLLVAIFFTLTATASELRAASPIFSSTTSCRAILGDNYGLCDNTDCEALLLGDQARCATVDCEAMVLGLSTS